MQSLAMAVVLFLLLLFLQQGNSEETLLSTKNETYKTCVKRADMCTYTLPRMEMEPDIDQCQVTFYTFVDPFGHLVIHWSICDKDKRVRENRDYFMANIVVVILVGTSTNLFNLISFAYVYFA